MTVTQLYEFCTDHGIEIYHLPLPHNASVSLYMEGRCAVGIDETGMTEADKRTHLAHEIGHCERLAFYTPYTPLETRSRNEYKANLWAVKKLLPKEKMQEALEQGMTELWQLIKYFNVNQTLIRFAMREYFDKEV